MPRKSNAMNIKMNPENIVIILLLIIFIILAVLYLTDNKEEAFTSGTGGVKAELTFYYADWCPHCTNFKPVFRQLESHINTHHSDNIKVKWVDCTDSNSQSALMARERGINGFPTMTLGNHPNTVEFSRGSLDDMKAALQQYLSQ